MDSLSERLAAYADLDGAAAESADSLARWEEGANLLIEAGTSEDPVDPPLVDRVHDALDAARHHAVERGDRPGLGPWVEGRVEELRETLAEIAGEMGGLAAVAEIVDEGRWLRLVLARTGQGRADVAFKDADREAAALAELGGRDRDRDAHVVAVRVALLDHRLIGLVRSSAARSADEDMTVHLTAVEALADEASRLARLAPGSETEALAERSGDEEKDLQRQVQNAIEDAEPDQAVELCTSLAGFVGEAADEARVLTAELPPEESARSLRRARRGLERVLSLWRGIPGSPTKPKPIRRLGRLRRRLRAEEQEMGLQGRLEGVFGRRLVTLTENVILLLILGVIGMLIYEGTADLSEETRLTLMWVDVGICAIFLTEIVVRLWLVPGGRLRWFVRHLPFDVLPSIPFGLLVEALAWLDVARAGRAARIGRVGRMARYVRAARPFVRLFRVVAFLLRGLDRIVHRNSRALNRDVLLFAPRTRTAAAAVDATVPAELEQEAFDLARLKFDEGDEGREAAIRDALERAVRFVRCGARAVAVMDPEAPVSRSRSPEIRIEELIDRLAYASATTVERQLGVDLTARLAEKLRWLDLPILRQLPWIRRFAPGARRLRDGRVVARASRALGQTIRRWYDRVLTVSDLSGMISGPQLLDRLGGALSKATGRPARRFLMIGVPILLVWILVMRLQMWQTVYIGDKLLRDHIKPLETYLGAPILILGVSCLILFLTGIWFRRLAGEATDFLERTAEAQYLNLLKIAKYRRLEQDLTLLVSRVFEPDRLLAGGVRGDPEKIAAAASRLREDMEQMLSGRHVASGRETPSGADLSRKLRVLELVHDYLDGATLHHSDRKITEQLLGNLALMNLWRRRLTLTREHRKRLKSLDLSREQGFRGPYLWFNSITRTIAQRTAELILEYNRRAMTLDEVSRLSPDEKEAWESWIAGRIEGQPAESFSEHETFRTSFFTALHFLTRDPRLVQSVIEAYGEGVLTALRADRRRLIREVFGTSPLHKLPRRKRVLNPYDLYRRHLAGLRIVLLPAKLVLLHFRGLWAFVRRLGQIVREVRRPELASQSRARGVAGFDVAMRKVGRMRGPVFRECAWLRALVDVEYLGLGVPGVPGRGVAVDFEDDLSELPMATDWRERFLDLREERRRDLAALQRILREKGVSRADVSTLVDETVEDPVAAARILRALCVGYAADDRDCRSLLTARERIEEAFDELLEDPLSAPRRGFLLRGFDLLREVAGCVSVRLDPLPRALLLYLAANPRSLRRSERRMLLRAARSDHRGIRRLLKLAGAREHAGRTRLEAWVRIRRVAADHQRVDEELLTLRTVQSLAVIDVRQYRDMIRRLGDYDSD